MEIYSEHLPSQTERAREPKFWAKAYLPPSVMCFMSHVTCQVSGFMCQVSCVMCHVSHVMYIYIFFLRKWWKLLVEALLSTRLPRLVISIAIKMERRTHIKTGCHYAPFILALFILCNIHYRICSNSLDEPFLASKDFYICVHFIALLYHK